MEENRQRSAINLEKLVLRDTLIQNAPVIVTSFYSFSQGKESMLIR